MNFLVLGRNRSKTEFKIMEEAIGKHATIIPKNAWQFRGEPGLPMFCNSVAF